MSEPVDEAVVGEPPAHREPSEDLEATDTMELSRAGLTSWDVQQRTAGVPRQPQGLDEAQRPNRHARRRALREPGTLDRRRRLALQAAYVLAFGLCSYLLLGGLGLVALPFDPASLIPGNNAPGSDQPATPPGPAETFTEPSVGSFPGQQPEPVTTPTTSDPGAPTSTPTPTSAATSTPTAGPTPSATASPTPTKKHPTPPGHTRTPTKPPH